MTSPACIFCAIVAGQAPASPIYEDDHVLAFLDIRPLSRGHTLIIPKRHASGLADLDPDDAGRIFPVARRIALALRASELPVDGVNLMLADGAAAMQTVFHVHIHAVPRRHGDKLRMASRMLIRRPGELADTARVVRSALARIDDVGDRAHEDDVS